MSLLSRVDDHASCLLKCSIITTIVLIAVIVISTTIFLMNFNYFSSVTSFCFIMGVYVLLPITLTCGMYSFYRKQKKTYTVPQDQQEPGTTLQPQCTQQFVRNQSGDPHQSVGNKLLQPSNSTPSVSRLDHSTSRDNIPRDDMSHGSHVYEAVVPPPINVPNYADQASEQTTVKEFTCYFDKSTQKWMIRESSSIPVSHCLKSCLPFKCGHSSSTSSYANENEPGVAETSETPHEQSTTDQIPRTIEMRVNMRKQSSRQTNDSSNRIQSAFPTGDDGNVLNCDIRHNSRIRSLPLPMNCGTRHNSGIHSLPLPTRERSCLTTHKESRSSNQIDYQNCPKRSQTFPMQRMCISEVTEEITSLNRTEENVSPNRVHYQNFPTPFEMIPLRQMRNSAATEIRPRLTSSVGNPSYNQLFFQNCPKLSEISPLQQMNNSAIAERPCLTTSLESRSATCDRIQNRTDTVQVKTNAVTIERHHSTPCGENISSNCDLEHNRAPGSRQRSKSFPGRSETHENAEERRLTVQEETSKKVQESLDDMPPPSVSVLPPSPRNRRSRLLHHLLSSVLVTDESSSQIDPSGNCRSSSMQLQTTEANFGNSLLVVTYEQSPSSNYIVDIRMSLTSTEFQNFLLKRENHETATDV